MEYGVIHTYIYIGSAIDGDGAGGLGEAGPRIAACRVVAGESCGRHLGIIRILEAVHFSV